MNGLPVGRILGFEVRIHLSWVLILALVAVVVVGQLELAAPDAEPALRWLVGALIAAAFLASVLAHELGHALVARRRGIRTGPITLYFFGGSALLDGDVDRPADEAAISAAGPAVSLAIGALLCAAALAFPAGSSELAAATAAVVLTLGVLNLILGVINLVPGFPLDGGRLLRAAVWARTGDRSRGTRVAATTGRVIGWTVVGGGIAVVLNGDLTNGLMLGLSGWFLANASRAVVRQQAVEELLRSVTVREAMERDVPSVPAQLTIDTFAEQLFGEEGVGTVPVVRDDELVGVIGPSQLRKLARGSWTTTRAEQLMVGSADVPALGPEESVWSALDRLRRSGLDGIPVVDASGVLGMLTRRAVVRAVQDAQQRGAALT
jgi:Zn-dependent protease